MREAPEFLVQSSFQITSDVLKIYACFFLVIVMSTESDNLKEFMIGRSTVRKVIESQEICERSSNSTGTVDSEENSDQEVHRIGRVNLLETYATSRQKI